MRNMTSDDFYEDDEPINKIRSDFGSSEKGRTRRVSHGKTVYLALSGVAPASNNEPSGKPVRH